MDIKSIQKQIHENAIAHGWWSEEPEFGTIIALCHSELSEALEEHRDGKPELYYVVGQKPEGVAIELADCIIRILDYCGHAEIDIAEVIQIKHEYNKSRPYKHGGKKY